MTDDLITWLRAQLYADEHALQVLLLGVHPTSGVADLVRQWLAEVDAKRRIIDLAERQAEMSQDVAFTIVRWFAYPYADREGYRDEEWRP